MDEPRTKSSIPGDDTYIQVESDRKFVLNSVGVRFSPNDCFG